MAHKLTIATFFLNISFCSSYNSKAQSHGDGSRSYEGEAQGRHDHIQSYISDDPRINDGERQWFCTTNRHRIAKLTNETSHQKRRDP